MLQLIVLSGGKLLCHRLKKTHKHLFSKLYVIISSNRPVDRLSQKKFQLVFKDQNPVKTLPAFFRAVIETSFLLDFPSRQSTATSKMHSVATEIWLKPNAFDRLPIVTVPTKQNFSVKRQKSKQLRACQISFSRRYGRREMPYAGTLRCKHDVKTVATWAEVSAIFEALKMFT